MPVAAPAATLDAATRVKAINNRSRVFILSSWLSCVAMGSSRLVRSILDQGLGDDEVRIPDLAPIVREGLLETAGGRRDVHDAEPDQDGPAVVGLLIVELAAAIFELAGHRNAQSTRLRVGEVDGPLVGIGVVEADGVD